MNILQISKEIGVGWKEVAVSLKEKYSDIGKLHYLHSLSADQENFIRLHFGIGFVVSNDVDSKEDWSDMPWDVELRTKTPGHKEWVRNNPRAWELYKDFERKAIILERERYIKQKRELWG